MAAGPPTSDFSFSYPPVATSTSVGTSVPGVPAPSVNGPPATSRPPPKKRNRQALSCTSCRERKIKCDRKIPCEQCIRRGDVDQCHVEVKGRDAPKPAPANAEEFDAIKNRLAQLESLLAAQTSGAAGQPGQPSYPPGYAGFPQFATGNLPPLPPLGEAPQSAVSTQQGLPAFLGNPTAPLPSRYALSSSLQYGGSSYGSPPSHSSPQPPATSYPPLDMRLHWNGNNQGVTSSTSPTTRAWRPPQDGHRQPGLPSSVGSILDSSNQRPRVGTRFSSPASSRFEEQEDTDMDDGNHGEDRGRRGSRMTSASETDCRPARTIDSDTEDAAQVLEGLAMGSAAGPCAPTGGFKGKAEQEAARRVTAEIVELKRQCREEAIARGQSVPDAVKCESAATVGASGKECMEGVEPFGQPSGCPGPISAPDPCTTSDKADGSSSKKLPPPAAGGPCGSKHYDPSRKPGLGFGLSWFMPGGIADVARQDSTFASDRVTWDEHEWRARQEVIRRIIAGLPDRKTADALVDNYSLRVKFLCGHVVHLPTLRADIDKFYSTSDDKKVKSVDAAWLASFIFVLILGLQFWPCRAVEPVSLEHLDSCTLARWHLAGKTCLHLANYLTNKSMYIMQAIIMLTVVGHDSQHATMSLLRVATYNAQEAGLHRLGDKCAKKPQNAKEKIKIEMGKRIWHMLVLKDWMAGAAIGSHMYAIHPGQFNTPLPDNLNDDDLTQWPTPPSRSRDEFTEVSHIFVHSCMAWTVRASLDAMLENNGVLPYDVVLNLDARFREILAKAPKFFQIGSQEGEIDVQVQRWLLHQGVLHKLLRLHRPHMSKERSRMSCVVLARSILDMQKKLRSTCTVIDRLWLNLLHSFSAAIVLIIDLLHTKPSPAVRMQTRGEIMEAISALKHIEATNYTAGQGIKVIEALLVEEEAKWNDAKDAGEANVLKRKLDADKKARKKELFEMSIRVARAMVCPITAGKNKMANEKLFNSKDDWEWKRIEVPPEKMAEFPTAKPSDTPGKPGVIELHRDQFRFQFPTDGDSLFETAPNSLEFPTDFSSFFTNSVLTSSPSSVVSGASLTIPAAQQQNQAQASQTTMSSSTTQQSNGSLPSLVHSSSCTSASCSSGSSDNASPKDQASPGSSSGDLSGDLDDSFWSWILASTEGGGSARPSNDTVSANAAAMSELFPGMMDGVDVGGALPGAGDSAGGTGALTAPTASGNGAAGVGPTLTGDLVAWGALDKDLEELVANADGNPPMTVMPSWPA